mgnify:FL=1
MCVFLFFRAAVGEGADEGGQLIRYFTCGPIEVRAWTIREGTKAPAAAGVIQCVLPSYAS